MLKYNTFQGEHFGDDQCGLDWTGFYGANPLERVGASQQVFQMPSFSGEAPTVPIPDFEDAYQTQRVLEAALLSAAERHPIKIDEVK
jgi:hypothetical protein